MDCGGPPMRVKPAMTVDLKRHFGFDPQRRYVGTRNPS